MAQIPNILLVEDHKDFRKAVHDFLVLQQIQAHIVQASSGEEAIVLAHKIKPKAVIIDFSLKGNINGVQAAKQIKEMEPKCSIIMLTMFNPDEIIFPGRNKIIKAFIEKSNLYEMLVPEIKRVFGFGRK